MALGRDVTHNAQPIGGPGIDDVDSVAREHEEMLAVGLDEIALVDAGGLVIGAGEITRLGRCPSRRRAWRDTRVEHDGPTPISPSPDILPESTAPLRDGRVDVPRLELVKIVCQPQWIGALVADDLLAGGKLDPVDPLRAEERVDARTAVERVSACASPERVDACLPLEVVVASAADERIVASSAPHRVVALAAIERVVAGSAIDRVAAIAAMDRVVASIAVELGFDAGIAGNVDGDRVVARAPDDPDGFDPRLQDRADDDAVDGGPQVRGIGRIAIDQNCVVGMGWIGVASDAPGAIGLADGQGEPWFERLKVRLKPRRLAAHRPTGSSRSWLAHRGASQGYGTNGGGRRL